MKIFNFSFFSDLVFSLFSSFLLCLVISSYFLAHPFNLVLSVSVSLLFTLFAFKYFYSKRSKKKSLEQQKLDIDALTTELCFYSKPKLLTLFEKAFSVKGERVEKRTTHLLLPNKNQALFFIFSFDGVKKADLVKAFNKLKGNENAVIYAPDFFNEIISFASRFKGRIILEKGNAVYSLLKETDLLPKTIGTLSQEKRKKASVNNFLEKKNSTKYFLFGALFLLLSFIVPFKIYYIVVGSLLMIFSLVLKFFIKDKELENAN